MDRAYVQWTVVNWITVMLMVTLGFFLLSFVAQTARKFAGGSMQGPKDG